MQMAAIEFARNVLGLTDAHSTEMDAHTANPVIDLMEEQKKVTAKGGTMRLGAYPCVLREGSLASHIYGGKAEISERHRHRWEFNNAYLAQFEQAGMIPSGANPESGLVEIIELASHPFFVGVQYHPELKSTVENPQPIFVHFIRAAKEFNEAKSAVRNPLLQSEMI
jgi:CTP synthase